MSALSNNEEDSEITFDNNTFQLKSISKKSNSEVWKYFGVLNKSDEIVIRFQYRILCRVCYENKQIKRYNNEIYC